jgi:hypothetical protein
VNRSPRERWTFTFELPAGIEHSGRFVARLIKHLLRAWGVKATAIIENPPDGQSEPAAPSRPTLRRNVHET